MYIYYTSFDFRTPPGGCIERSIYTYTCIMCFPPPGGDAAPKTPAVKSISNTGQRLVTISIEAPHSRYRD